MTGLPCSITKKRPIAKERSIFVNIFHHKSNRSFGLYLSSQKGNLSWLKPEINQAKKTFCAHHTQPSFRLCERTWAPRTGSQFLPGLQVSKGEQQTIHLRISSVHEGTWFIQLQTNKFQGLFKPFSNLQITVSRTKIFFKPLLNTLLVKTHHGVIYDLNFFSHGWPHYFILISEQNLAKWLVEKAIKSVKTNFIRMSWCTEKYLDKGIVVWRTTCVSEFWPMVTCRNWLNKLIHTSPSGKK